MNKKAYIILESGEIFRGERFGADGETVGELVFTTGMGGYIETLTDPSYYGQIILQTFPLIGNYGFICDDCESSGCRARAYVVREWCSTPSNFRCEENVDEWLKKHGVIGVSGIDTRALTKIIREHGVLRARISDSPVISDKDKTDLLSYRITDALKAVSTKTRYTVESEAQNGQRVALIDYGAKGSIAKQLASRGCSVTVFPYNVAADEILDFAPDGVMLSNGPGDPADNVYEIEQIRKLVGKIPMFGICLGHQLLALACGAKTEKLKYGHRGVNVPVRDLEAGRTYISSQNHGYAVVSDSLDRTTARLRYINANDSTCEGIDYPSLRAFSVQFHPEACAGPLDTRFLFDRFISMMTAYSDRDLIKTGGKADAAL